MNLIIQNYLENIKAICPKLTDEALILLSSKIEILELHPKENFIEADVLQKSIGYIYSGLLRAFYINEKGEDITVNFIDEKKLVVHLDALNKKKPSKFSFQAIEPSIILNIPIDHLEYCTEKYPLFEKYLRIMLEQIYSRMFNRLEALLDENAEERYLNFVEEFPTMYNRVTISHLCTYLGITRQSLTRIRKNINEGK
ncbi:MULTISPECIES: Crp/Fnr family transcriptional regulator [Empedobacter]|uniref:Crp/Fnr family transcriptional regulator n=1 Tax=Empedobacter falsenii TaxID=343874 RepID=A0A7H9DRL3_9FLAO|nr:MULTISPECIES: Crp/Fnr family transcriptional regulator [Empedobacter]QLL57764.1 Crp/Fnr family transcriptional regulator [Empedobacter falsenii]